MPRYNIANRQESFVFEVNGQKFAIITGQNHELQRHLNEAFTKANALSGIYVSLTPHTAQRRMSKSFYEVNLHDPVWGQRGVDDRVAVGHGYTLGLALHDLAGKQIEEELRPVRPYQEMPMAGAIR